MKNIEQHIKWSSNTNDPNSRVFFVGDRVFRAFWEERILEVQDFLNSEAFAILQERGMIVRTWIPSDVQIDGALVVEHERLICVPAHWQPYESLRDILRFHYEIDTLCRQYGYAIRDVGLDNVILHKGQLCFVDFGSFRKASSVEEDVLYADENLTDALIPLVLYQRNNGYDFIADMMIDNYAWKLASGYPTHSEGLYDWARPFLRPITEGYKLKLARYHSSITVHCWLTIKLINCVNKLSSCIMRMPKWWRLIKITNVYSRKKVLKWLDSISYPTQEYGHKSEIVNTSYASILNEVIPTMKDVKRITSWGNFAWEDILNLRKTFTGELVIVTSDKMYANMLYKKVKAAKVDIMIVLSNAMMGRDTQALDFFRTDLLVLPPEVIQNSKIITHTVWAEKSAMFAKNLLIPALGKEDEEGSQLNKFWSNVWNNQSFQLFAINH